MRTIMMLIAVAFFGITPALAGADCRRDNTCESGNEDSTGFDSDGSAKSNGGSREQN